MPRNASGTSTLVAGNPVATNTIIESDWANTTMADLNNEMTDSLSRSGKGGMTAQFRAVNGSAATPAISFSDFPQSGLYAFSENDIRMSVAGVDRFRWLQANALPQTWDSDSSVWLDVGGGGVIWTQMDVAPATAVISTGYVTLGGQTIAMPANPPTGFSVAFADKADDWDATNYLTITGNGNTFSQDSSGTYILDLKGAFAQFSYLEGQWQIVNFGRLSDAYGFDGNDFERKDQAFNNNILINGGFDIWQRGESFVNPTGYTADRWYTPIFTTGGQGDVTREAFAAGQTDVAGSPEYYMRIDQTVAVASTYNPLEVRIEDARTLAGQAFSLSFWIKSSVAKNLDVYLSQVVTSGAAGNQLIGTVSLVTGWAEYKITGTASGLSGAVIGSDSYLRLFFQNTEQDICTLDFAQLKLEEGSTATPFTRAGNNIAGELAMCQRYFSRGDSEQDALVRVNSTTTLTRRCYIQYPATMRVTPDFNFVEGGTWSAPPSQSASSDAGGTGMSGLANSAGSATSITSWTADAEL